MRTHHALPQGRVQILHYLQQGQASNLQRELQGRVSLFFLHLNCLFIAKGFNFIETFPFGVVNQEKSTSFMLTRGEISRNSSAFFIKF
jgi:hypothetical protein